MTEKTPKKFKPKGNSLHPNTLLAMARVVEEDKAIAMRFANKTLKPFLEAE